MFGLTIFQLKKLKYRFCSSGQYENTAKKKMLGSRNKNACHLFFSILISPLVKNQAAAASSSLKLHQPLLHQAVNFFCGFVQSLRSAFFAAQDNVACVDEKLFSL